MRLVPVSTVSTVLGWEDIPDLNEALGAVLDSVTDILAARLKTDFDLYSRVDKYQVQDSVFVRGMPRSHLLLSQSFVDRTSLQVQYSDQFVSLESAPDRTDITSEVSLDIARSCLSVFTRDLSGRFVRVAYTAGFGADTSDGTVYDQTAVPSWLQTLAITLAKQSISNDPRFKQEDPKFRQITDPGDLKLMAAGIDSVIAHRIRIAPKAMNPIFRGFA